MTTNQRIEEIWDRYDSYGNTEADINFLLSQLDAAKEREWARLPDPLEGE